MQDEFSPRIELPHIPEGPGVAILENERGEVLQIVMSNNIRRRIGELMDSQGTLCPYGPRVYGEQQDGQQIYVRWKITDDYKSEKKRLLEKLNPSWGQAT